MKNQKMIKKIGKKMCERIVNEQSDDGSWGQIFVSTANNLWNLFLLDCDTDDKTVKRGLE